MAELKPNGLVSANIRNNNNNATGQTAGVELKTNGLVSGNIWQGERNTGKKIESADANNDGMFDVRDLVAAKKKQLTSSGTVRQYNDMALSALKQKLLTTPMSENTAININGQISPLLEKMQTDQIITDAEIKELIKTTDRARHNGDLTDEQRNYFNKIYEAVYEYQNAKKYAIDKAQTDMESAKKELESAKKNDVNAVQKALNYVAFGDSWDANYESEEKEYAKAAAKYYALKGYDTREKLEKLKNTTKNEDERKALTYILSGKSGDIFENIVFAGQNIVPTILTMVGKTGDALIANPINMFARLFGAEGDVIGGTENGEWVQQADELNIKMQQNSEAYGDKMNVVGTLSNMLAFTIPSIAMAYATGGASAPSALAEASQLYQLMNNPVYWTTFVMTYGTEFEEMKKMGADDMSAYLGATISTLINSYIEQGGVQEAVAKNSFNSKAGKELLLEFVESSLEEGGEEILQGGVTRLTGRFATGDFHYDKNETNEYIINNLKEGLSGVIGGAIMGGGNITVEAIANYSTSAQYQKLGKEIRNSQDDIADIIAYARSSENEMIRSLASESKISDTSLGMIYSYMCRDVIVAFDTENGVDGINQNLKGFVNQLGVENPLLEGVVVPQYLISAKELNIPAEQAMINVASAVADSFEQGSDIEAAEETKGAEDTGVSEENAAAESSAEAEAAPATKSESGFEEVSVKPITVTSTELSGIETTEVDTKHLSAKQRTVRSIGRALGVKITFANVENADGYYIKGSNEIVMDYNTVDPIRTVMVHEITHFAQNNEKAWSGFVAAVQKSEAFAKWINGYNYTYYDNAEAAKNDKHTSNKLNIIKEDIKQLYLANGEELSDADIEYEVYAKFCGETLFASNETRDESLESILAGATQKDRNAISRFIHKFVEWIKSKLPNTSYSATLERLENKWLEMVENTEIAVDNDTENGVSYSYNEYNTNAMIWANAADRQSGDVKILNRNGKEFVLLKADGEGGYTELIAGKISEVEEEYDRYISDTQNKLDEVAENIRAGKDGHFGNSIVSENGRRNSRNTKSSRSKGLQDNAARDDEYLRTGDRGESIKQNTEKQASDEGAFSLPENGKRYSIPSENVRHNQERYLKWLYKSWGLTKYSEEDLKADIKDLRHAVAIYNKGGKYREEARGIIKGLAEKALTEYERVRLTSDAKGIRKAIRSYTFKLTDKQKQEAEYYYGSVSKFAKATGLKISDNANMWLDSLWQEWAEMYPEFFNEDMNEGDMIERLASVIDSLSNMTESYDVDEMLSYNVPEIANQIIYDLENSGDPAKRKAVEEYKKNVVEPQRIGRTKTEIRGQIKGLYDRMLKMDQNPTKYSYIPKQFRDAVRELLYVASGIYLKRNSTELPAKIAAVCDKYQRLKNNQDPDVQSVYDENVALELQDLRDLLEEKTIYDEDMSVPVLRQIYRHMRSIYGMIMDAKSLIGEKEKLSIQEAGQDIVFEQDEIRKNKSAQNTVEKWFSNANNVSSFFYLNSLRAVLRMSNYNENTTLYRMFYALNQGLQKSYDFQMRINKKLDALVKTKEGQKAYEEAVNKKIDFGWGKMTKMQVAQIMLTLKRESAIGTVHIIKGGATITDSKYHDNVTKRRDNAETIRFGYMNMSYLDDMQEVIDNDKWLQEYIKVAKEILQKDTAKAINETSEILVHRDMAVGDEYIPFVTDRSFVVQEIEEVVRDATLEGNGHLKSTLKRAGNALYIEGLDVVLADAINFAAKYSGLAIPIRNINKVLNYKNDLAGQSVKNSIKKNWKQQGLDIITQTIADLQTVRKNDRIAIIDNLKAAFITSTLAGNISVSIKQAASLFTAFSVLNYRNPATVWAKFAKTVKNYDSIIEEIDKHTSEHWRRRIGLTTDEVAAIQQNTGFFGKLTKKFPKAINGLKWIQAIDCFTTATFWNMAKEDISKQIKKGELDAEVGDEVYWKEVTELYEKTIEETQPMYDPLHRSEMQKNAVSNKIFMFKTQPLQNAGLFFTDLHALLSAKATGDKLLIKERSNQLVKTIISQTESAITFAIMTLAAAALMGNMKRYKDKDNEVTLSSVLGMVGQDALKTGTGVLFPIGGSEVFDYLSALREKKSFGRSLVSHPVVEWFNKYADSISTLYKDPSFDNIVNMLTMLGDLTGQPVTNYKNIIRGVVWNIEDAVNGDLGDFIAGDEKAHEKGAKIKRIIVASEKGDTKKKNDLITRFRKEYPEENIQALIHKQYMLDKEIIAQAEKALPKVGKAYSELTEDQQKDVVTDVKGYNATEKAIEIKGLDKADFDNLYTLKRTDTAKYKDEKQKLLKKYSGAEVSQGLEYAKVRYMVSKGISVERYYASKKYANSYDPDKSGGASEKEKRAALKKLGFTEEQIRAFLGK